MSLCCVLTTLTAAASVANHLVNYSLGDNSGRMLSTGSKDTRLFYSDPIFFPDPVFPYCAGTRRQVLPGPVESPPPGPVERPPPGPVESPPPGPVERPPPGPVERPPPGPVEQGPPGPVEPMQAAKALAETNMRLDTTIAATLSFMIFGSVPLSGTFPFWTHKSLRFEPYPAVKIGLYPLQGHHPRVESPLKCV